jgi:pimeloyl-ACP methyl ester carboxylesterase
MYQFEQSSEMSDLKTMWLTDAQNVKCEPYSSVDLQLEFLTTRRGEQIATMYIQRPGAITTIIFSHGNATDLGAMRDHLRDLAVQINVNIFAYDYSGYGLSSGKPSPANTLADMDAVFAHVRERYSPRFVIAYGQSLGSGPTLHIARKHPTLVSGVVIHSGLMSGLRVLRAIDTTKWFDIYPNVDNMKVVRAPVLVMHGIDDKDVPIHHGIALSEASPNCYPPWFVEGGGHNNLEVHWRPQYLARLSEFVRDIENGKAEILRPGEGRRTKELRHLEQQDADGLGAPIVRNKGYLDDHVEVL